MTVRQKRPKSRVILPLPTGELRDVALVIIGVKILLWAFSFFAVPAFFKSPEELISWWWFLDVWHKWDAWWYVKIAETGYPMGGYFTYLIAFLPLFPLLTHLVAIPLEGNAVLASIIVANILSAAGLFLFYLLARHEFGQRVAWYSLLCLLLFPSAYIFNAGYSEAPYLLFTVGAFYFARQARWLPASLFGVVASSTRLAGIFLLPALLVEFYLQVRQDSRPWRSAVWLLLIPLGLAFYLSLNRTLFGDPLAFMDIVGNHWQRTLAWPGISFMNSWRMIGTFPYNAFEFNRGVMEIAGGVFLVVAGGATFFFLRSSYAAFTLLSILLVLTTSKLESVWRYALASFPLFFVLGIVVAKNKAVRMLAMITSVGLMFIFLLLFVTGRGGY